MVRKFYVERNNNNDALVDYLVAIKYDARATTLHYIKNITEEELDWLPYEGWNTIGALLEHIIAGEQYFKRYFIEEKEFTKEEEERWLPGLDLGKYVSQLKGKSAEQYVRELTESRIELEESIRTLSAEKLLERRMGAYDKVTGCDLAWVLYHSAEDEVHHRGQISITRKLYKKMREGKL